MYCIFVQCKLLQNAVVIVCSSIRTFEARVIVKARYRKRRDDDFNRYYHDAKQMRVVGLPTDQMAIFSQRSTQFRSLQSVFVTVAWLSKRMTDLYLFQDSGRICGPAALHD